MNILTPRLSLIVLSAWLCVVPLRAANETYSVWDGTTAPVTPEGKTYHIKSAAQLAWIAEQNDAKDGFKGCTVILDENIDLNGSDRRLVWTPIGSAAHPFTGVFDGQHKLIRGLYSVAAEAGIGIFGYVGKDGTKVNIHDLGISGGCLIAFEQTRVGTLVGVCGGKIERCWSMAEIAMSGDVTGGLIGELLAGGSLTDAYCCSHIRNAGDTIGVIVGMNAGAITRTYSTGYAENGCAFVGYSTDDATYKKCYYDRKLYYQEPGIITSGLAAVNDTYEMFDCMKSALYWKTSSHSSTQAGCYPQLKDFVGTDASKLSTAYVLVDTELTSPINHANDLTEPFRVDISDGIQWRTQRVADEEWIQFTEGSDIVEVVRPCSETDVLANATYNDEQKTVYFRPRRLDDFRPGTFMAQNNREIPVCFGEDVDLGKYMLCEPVDTLRSKNGFGTNYYMVIRYGLDANANNAEYVMDTLKYELPEDDYLAWCTSSGTGIKGDSAGHFVLRAFVHDERCVTDWTECKAKIRYNVLPALEPGIIPTRHDTLYLDRNNTASLTIQSLTPASGGSGRYGYAWRNSKDGDEITGFSPEVDLTYTFHEPADKLEFWRAVTDSTDCEKKVAGCYTVTVFSALDAGKVEVKTNNAANDKLLLCSLAEAKAYKIDATKATGGSGKYLYQWYLKTADGWQAIDKATGEDFVLSTITLQTGKDYTFARKVQDDTRFTDWTMSEGQQTIYILDELQGGAIVSAWDTLCLSADGKITVTVTGKTPATGGYGKYRYSLRKTPDGEDLVSSTNGTLTYTVKSTAKKLSLYRYVTDETECGGKLSEGVYIVTILNEFTPGAIDVEQTDDAGKLIYCTVDEAKTHTIHASAPTGGSGTYNYQWYTLAGGNLTELAGATTADLALSSITLNAGTDYTFVRQVRDVKGCATDWIRTANRQHVHIMAALDAGAIDGGDRGAQCLLPDNPWAEIKITELRKASGETALSYRWMRISEDGSEEQISTQPELSLNWRINSSNRGKTYTYVRYVSQEGCSWMRSEGTVTERYGITYSGERHISICVSQLPYTMDWYDSKGTKYSHTFENDGEWKVTDNYSPGGCPADTTIYVHVAQRPEISGLDEAQFCQTESRITIGYDQTKGEADMFVIRYSDDLAKQMGSKDTVGAIINEGVIVIRNVPPLPEGNYYVDVQVGISSGSYKLDDIECYSSVTRVTIKPTLGGYVHSKFSRVLYVDNNPDNGEVPAPKLHFKAYQWYKNGVTVEGQTGQYYEEKGNELRGVYHVMLTDDNGNKYRSCDIIMPEDEYVSQAAPTAVHPVPVNAGDPVSIACMGGKAEICSSAGEVVLTTDCPDERVTVNAPHTPGIYYVRITHGDGTTLTEKLIVK